MTLVPRFPAVSRAPARSLCLAGLALHIGASTAQSPLKSGSVLVVVATKDEVAMAADSRTTADQDLKQTDDACKVSTPEGKFLFGSTGVLSGTGRVTFDARDEMRRVVQADPAALGSPGDLVRLWGEAIRGKLASLPPEQLARAAEYTEGGGNLICAVLAGVDPAGEISVARSTISYQGAGANPSLRSKIETFRLTRSIQVLTCGYGAVVDQYASASDPQAVEEKKKWKSYSGDRPARMALRLVELTINFQQPKNFEGRSIEDVGGPVDAVELKRGGPIEWLQRKPTCPAD